jgi:membrane protease YdiL (CAAX protease family)
MEPSKLLVILVFCLILRAFFGIVFKPYFEDYYVDLAGQTILNFALFGFCCYQFKLNRSRISEVFGRWDWSVITVGSGVGLLLLMFTFGESAVTTVYIAQHDMQRAYELGRFHEEFHAAHPFFSVHVMSYVLAAVCFPAVFEEFFFRGLLFPAFAEKHSSLKSAIICSLIFTALHFTYGYKINTFLFAFVLCIVYAHGGSLYTAIVAHAVYNFFAFVCQYYFDFHRTRSIQNISSLSDWVPQLTMLVISISVFSILAYQNRTFLMSWLQKTGRPQGSLLIKTSSRRYTKRTEV